MSGRLAPVGAILCVVGLVVGLALYAPGRSSRHGPVSGGDVPRDGTPPGTSDSRCAVPIGWRIARLDPQFGLSAAEARAAVERAAALWERAVRRRLFSFDGARGVPVHFVYDERQARTRDRIRLEREIEVGERRLDSARAQLDRSLDDHARRRARHRERVRDFESRLSSHNALVRRWNEGGGAPPGVLAESREAAAAFAAERQTLDARRGELEAEAWRLREDEERFDRDLRAHRRMTDEFQRAFSPTSMEAGLYREAVRTGHGPADPVYREIRIHRYDDGEDLVRVLAHELGHALGLGHAAEPGSIMSPASGGEAAPALRAPAAIHLGDVERLRARCPNL